MFANAARKFVGQDCILSGKDTNRCRREKPGFFKNPGFWFEQRSGVAKLEPQFDSPHAAEVLRTCFARVGE